MGKMQDAMYRRGYVAGYRDGITAGASGMTLSQLEEDVKNLPIGAMELSTRAYHCLSQADCETIGDVVALDEYAIIAMRGLGARTRSEIAKSLDMHGSCYSVWSKYL